MPDGRWYHALLVPRILLLAALSLGSCTPKPPDSWPGVSSATGLSLPQPQPSVKAQKHERWTGYDQLVRLELAEPEPVPASNHEPFRWNLWVRINSESKALYESWRPGLVMPLGTLLVAEHRSRLDSTAGPYYFASKDADGWHWGQASPDGWLEPHPDACAGCHAMAPADFVFGIVAKPRTSE